MDTTGIEIIWPADAPLIIGYDDGSPPVLVYATGYGEGFRLNQVFYIRGSDVEAELNRVPPLLVRYEPNSGVDGSDALLEVGGQRPPTLIPELGIQVRSGTDADVNSFVDSVDDDPPTGTREPAGPASIHDEQSDKRPADRRRTVDESTADSAAIADQNALSTAESFRDPEDSTYDLDDPAPASTRRRKVTR